MAVRKVGFPEIPEQIAAGLAKIRTEQEIPEDFPAEVTAAAEQAAANPRLPERDLTDVDFVTIDPPGATDLDQAVHISRAADGFLVRYAIADVAAFVSAGDPIDLEVHRRGVTFYAPDRRTPLHPPVLSEGAASLLPEENRPALVWEIRLDAAGEPVETTVARALVRSRIQYTYEQVQQALDDGSADESLQLLRAVGQLREELERERGGVSLNIPEQQVNTDDGHWSLEFRSPLPVEGWNAQISLLTGMAAATIMLDGTVGILRTLPPAEDSALRKLRHTAEALHIDWPADRDYPDFVRSLDPARTDHAAMMSACTLLFRGAGYLAFQGGEKPTEAKHAALAIEYAHTTAPLRRLVDRYVGEICVALCAGEPVPDWVTAALDALPEEMAEADKRSRQYEGAVISLVEAALLADQVGDTFDAGVIEVNDDRTKGTVILEESAVEAKITGHDLPLGEVVRATLIEADSATRVVRFERAGAPTTD
ncbi:MAG: RNB domain-containing ribonuclease [Propionibacteriaceae bacterium]